MIRFDTPTGRGPMRSRKKHFTQFVLWAGAILMALQLGLITDRSAGAASESAKKARVELLVDHDAIAPGQRVELALSIELEDDWHVYWRNRGEGGLEPHFEWDMPEGFAIGQLHWPSPRRHVDAADTHTFILEHEAILLTDVTAPAALEAGQEVTIGLEADLMLCKNVCIREIHKVAAVLPVVASADEAQPANGSDFTFARNRLPQPQGEARHLDALSAVASVDRIVPGESFEVGVVLDISENYYINSNRPTIEDFIATDVFHHSTRGLMIGRPRFPPPVMRDSPIGELSLFTGRTVIVLPVEADRVLDATELTIRGEVTYQACDEETGMCLRPTSAEWAVTLPVAEAGEEAQPANTEIFQEAEAYPVDDEPDTEPLDTATTLQRIQIWFASWGVVGYVVLALLGGFILNLTPCVLPIVSIKVLSFVQQAGEHRLRILTLGLAFAAGIVVSFIALGLLIVGLGQQWGGLFQTPQVVIGLVAVVTAFALSLFGVFSVNPPRAVGELGQKVRTEGHHNAFATGLLATVLGTACTAPFLSAVVAIAAQQPPSVGLFIFAMAGTGMALPYVLLAANPAWLKVVPRPGPWMTTFEHLMGFLLLAITIMLLDSLEYQIGGRGLLWTLVFLLFVAAAAWLYGRVGYDAPRARKLRTYVIVALLLVVGWLFSFRWMQTIPQLMEAQHQQRVGVVPSDPRDLTWEAGRVPWVPYTREQAEQLVQEGYTVFINYTARWCTNCKVNESAVIDTEPVRAVMAELGVVPMKADYTSFDQAISEDLERFGRAGVPMYLIYPANQWDDPLLLDEMLTRDGFIRSLRRAGPSSPTMPRLEQEDEESQEVAGNG